MFVLWTLGLLPLTEKQLGEGLGVFLVVLFWASSGCWDCASLTRPAAAYGGACERASWARVLSYLPFFLGFVVIGFSTRKRGLHDMVAGTLVLWKRRAR